MSKKKTEQYSEQLIRLYPELFTNDKNNKFTRTVTFQVTDKCNLCCTYCYQINKGTRRMSFETAKKMIDSLLNDETEYCNQNNSQGIIIEFIGGEPFLEIELMDKIIDYFKEQAFEKMHPWAEKYMISISSNGTLYNDKRVQNFLWKNKTHLSLNITIDGNKELHDKCRIFPDGSGSYDLAYAAAQDWISKGGQMGSKITICPQNLDYLNDAISYFIDTGYDEIFANCVFEEGWTKQDATKFYNKLKILADHLIDTGLCETHYISLFEQELFHPMTDEDNQNWCGGTGLMLSMDPDGYYYPCIRYMESSLGNIQKPMRIGHCDIGIVVIEEDKHTIECLNCITRRSQSTDECYYCPIAKGCAWCSAYNYQVNGTPDKRCTYICDMHKARALANVYYWNKQNIHIDNYCPKEWALEIISEDEYEMLNNLANSTK